MSVVQTFEAGVAPVRIKSDKAYAYPVEINIPDYFVIDKAFLRVNKPVKGKKVSVGIRGKQDYLVKNADVSSIGVVIPGIIRDKEGNILDVTLGPGLCDVKAEKKPITRPSKKKDAPPVKIGEKTIYHDCYPKECANISGEKLFIQIPEGCGMDQPHGGLRVKVYVVGYQL